MLIHRYNHGYMDGICQMFLLVHHICSPGCDIILDALNYKIPRKLNFLLYLNFVLKGPYFAVREFVQNFSYTPWMTTQEGKSAVRYFSWLSTDLVTLDAINKIRSKSGAKNITVNQVIFLLQLLCELVTIIM